MLLSLGIERMLTSGLRELPVIDVGGRLLGSVDDETITRAYQRRAPPSTPPTDEHATKGERRA
jgi:hypothetical protein